MIEEPTSLDVLVVTASRDLADDTMATAWAGGILRTWIKRVGFAGIVMTGDARGGDQWAIEFARLPDGRTRGLRTLVFSLDGFARMELGGQTIETTEWGGPALRAQTVARRWPLIRNEALIARAKRYVVEERFRVHVLALKAPWSRTHGTDQTAGVARRAELPVWWKECSKRS